MAGWSPSDIRANLSSTGAGAGTATVTELGNKEKLALKNIYMLELIRVIH